MGATINRTHTALTFSTDLLERLKKAAKLENQSLDSFVERMLTEAMSHVPNAETIAAIEEAQSGKELETLDVDNLKSYISSL